MICHIQRKRSLPLIFSVGQICEIQRIEDKRTERFFILNYIKISKLLAYFEPIRYETAEPPHIIFNARRLCDDCIFFRRIWFLFR